MQRCAASVPGSFLMKGSRYLRHWLPVGWLAFLRPYELEAPEAMSCPRLRVAAEMPWKEL